MRFAVTGGTGFLGRHIARRLVSEGHEVVLIARGVGPRDEQTFSMPGIRWVRTGLDDASALSMAMEGCDGVAHCAGINRELRAQTYRAVHVDGTRNVVDAARSQGLKRIVLISFLRARPDCGSGYHESKFAAEEIVRNSGLEYTILKPGVIYGRGDHMLDHLSHALYTFPIFALVGMRDRPVRPVAVDDVARVCCAALLHDRLENATVAVLGPEQLSLGEAVRRVARVTERRTLFFRMPVWFHMVIGWMSERLMTVPLVSLAQVRILKEGIVDPVHVDRELPEDLRPKTSFTDREIVSGLPEPGRCTTADLRPCMALRTALGFS